MGKVIDLTGQRFGRLVVLEFDHVEKEKSCWKCLCNCGKEIIVRGNCLKTGHTKSCGCYHKERTSETNFLDLGGQRFGRLMVLELDHISKTQGAYWRCLCDCENVKSIRASSLKSNKTTSCGCYNKEQATKSSRIEFGKASKNILYRRYKSNAKKRNLEFNLSREFFDKITQQNCFYCGREPFYAIKSTRNTGDYVYTGIDRIDSSNGYTEQNVIPSCGLCNQAKSSKTQQDFLLWVKRVYEHSIKDDFHDLDFLDF